MLAGRIDTKPDEAISASATGKAIWIPLLNYVIFSRGVFLLGDKVDGSQKTHKNSPRSPLARTHS
jgi:hypothetical protein